MPSRISKRARPGEPMRGQPKKKIRLSKRQQEYHSSSEDEDRDQSSGANAVPVGRKHAISSNFTSVDSQGIHGNAHPPSPPDQDDEIEVEDAATNSSDEDLSNTEASGHENESDDDESVSDSSTSAHPKKRKRQDPAAFANSISKILGSKLSNAKRADPMLARSKDAALASKEISEAKIETKARSKIRDEKRAALEKGREKDVLGLQSTDRSTGQALEEERRLKKTAQRGVVKLFNAVRAAQVKGEEAAREARKSQVIGMDRREDKATEMSKQGFLDLIAGGGKPALSSTTA